MPPLPQRSYAGLFNQNVCAVTFIRKASQDFIYCVITIIIIICSALKNMLLYVMAYA